MLFIVNATVFFFVFFMFTFLIPVLNTAKFKGFIMETKYMFIVFFVLFNRIVYYLNVKIKCDLYTDATYLFSPALSAVFQVHYLFYFFGK